MSKSALIATIVIALLNGTTSVVVAQQSNPVPWNRCCGLSPWPAMGPGMMGGGMMGGGYGKGGMMGGGGGGYGSMPRMHFAMMSGVPAPYNSMSNPLPRTRETVERGAKLYEQNCASCHGTTGLGDGPVGRNSRRHPPISRFFRKCRWFSGTRSCTGPSLRAARSLGVRCPHSRARCPKTISGQLSPTYRPGCHRQRLSKNKKRIEGS